MGIGPSPRGESCFSKVGDLFLWVSALVGAACYPPIQPFSDQDSSCFAALVQRVVLFIVRPFIIFKMLSLEYFDETNKSFFCESSQRGWNFLRLSAPIKRGKVTVSFFSFLFAVISLFH